MQPHERFKKLDKRFWANVRTISQALGYTAKKTRQVRVYTIAEMATAMNMVGLGAEHLIKSDNSPTEFGTLLHHYFSYRADVLNTYVEPRLMDVERATLVFGTLRTELNSTRFIPMNKQTGTKKTPAFLTGIVNMLIEANAAGFPCDYDPRILTTITHNNEPLRTLARRVDGCFPAATNPIAIWEIKEYYYTTTFGSRIADGVYETLLDGLELEELREHEGIDIQHLLIVDAHFTWWVKGKSYLCRIIDMLNMGYIDEVLFGYEVIEQLPRIVQEWVAIARQRGIK
ncbi:MAG: hypothetical protein H7175_23265 [Burkholderiales bacterium]|nr:hypothetical protein [Anaerolineae bacterium]